MLAIQCLIAYCCNMSSFGVPQDSFEAPRFISSEHLIDYQQEQLQLLLYKVHNPSAQDHRFMFSCHKSPAEDAYYTSAWVTELGLTETLEAFEDVIDHDGPGKLYIPWENGSSVEIEWSDDIEEDDGQDVGEDINAEDEVEHPIFGLDLRQIPWVQLNIDNQQVIYSWHNDRNIFNSRDPVVSVSSTNSPLLTDGLDRFLEATADENIADLIRRDIGTFALVYTEFIRTPFGTPFVPAGFTEYVPLTSIE